MSAPHEANRLPSERMAIAITAGPWLICRVCWPLSRFQPRTVPSALTGNYLHAIAPSRQRRDRPRMPLQFLQRFDARLRFRACPSVSAATAHTRTMLSASPVQICVPPCASTIAFIAAGVSILPIADPSAVFQARIDLSKEAENSVLPSAENAKAVIAADVR